jgi:hypothetical protein
MYARTSVPDHTIATSRLMEPLLFFAKAASRIAGRVDAVVERHDPAPPFVYSRNSEL